MGIDNNPAENAIRPWALGRKNWLFVANGNGGEMAAVINSLVVTCKDNKIDFEAWLPTSCPGWRAPAWRISTSCCRIFGKRNKIDSLKTPGNGRR